MKKILLCVACVIGISYVIPAWSFLFNSCDAGSKEPRPAWVIKTDYSLAGYHVGVGSADRNDKSKDEQSEASRSAARSQLAEGIESIILSENMQNTRISNKDVHIDAQSRVEVRAEEVLRDLQIKERWVDPDTCTLYTLMVVSKASVKQAKNEKIMKRRVESFKVQLAEGEDRNKNRDIKVRRKYLEDAQSLLLETDFNLLPEEIKKEVYAKRLNEALAQLGKESAQVKGRMALVALNEDGTLRAAVLGKILDQLRVADNSADRLPGACKTEDDCIRLATERGFGKLVLLRASSKVGVSQMGAYKGTLTISRTVFDIESRNKQGPQTVSSQVIGWSNEELDWLSAVDKAMQDMK